MSRLESAVIVQARTGKIGLKDYLYKIKAASSPKCLCGHKRQTVYHTLLECPGFNELRERMWEEGRHETDLIKFLDIPALAAKASKFLLTTSELMQFRQRRRRHRRGTEKRRFIVRDNTPSRMLRQSYIR